MPEIPDVAVQAAMARKADLLSDCPSPTALSEETLTRLMLEAAADAMERAWRRRVAREILALDAADSAIPHSPSTNKGPFGDVRASVNRLARGQSLPRPEELRGGNHA